MIEELFGMAFLLIFVWVAVTEAFVRIKGGK